MSQGEEDEPVSAKLRKSATAGRSARSRGDTRRLLVAAAAAEFNDVGYDGTDSNRIARRAGFAPQTFYRWFEDKAEIFIAVYEDWQAAEATTLRELLTAAAPAAALADGVVAHHRGYLTFRRSLRQLTYESARVRAARAESRKRQIAFIRSLQGPGSADEASLAPLLLQVERLADAIAEGEYQDMGLPQGTGEAALAALIGLLCSPPTTAAVSPTVRARAGG